MNNFVLLFICLTLGFLFKRVSKFPSNTAKALNTYIIYLSLPAVVFTQIPNLFHTVTFNYLLVYCVLIFWLIFIVTAIITHFVGRFFKWNNKAIGALALTAGFANTSFVGFPLLESLIGPEALKIGVLVDQIGSFLACASLGVALAGFYTKEKEAKIQYKKMAINILSFPPLICLIVVALLLFLEIPIHESIHESAKRIASTLVPLALFAVGFQLHIKKEALANDWPKIFYGLGLRLVVTPLLFFFITKSIFKSDPLMAQTIFLETAMAPMITSAVIANEYGLDGELANLMVGIGIPLSLISVPLWHYLFNLI